MQTCHAIALKIVGTARQHFRGKVIRTSGGIVVPLKAPSVKKYSGVQAEFWQALLCWHNFKHKACRFSAGHHTVILKQLQSFNCSICNLHNSFERTSIYSTLIEHVVSNHIVQQYYIQGQGILAPNYYPKNQFDIYFLTVWEYWLGIAKPKNVFRSILNPYIK